MKTIFIKILVAAALPLLVSTRSLGQNLDPENKLGVVLKDGTQVILYGRAAEVAGTKTNEYYYLPTGLRLCKNVNGDPKFMFMKFITNARETAGGISGALMHFLMEWGLTEEQLKEAEEKAKVKVPNARVMGPAAVETNSDRSFAVTSAALSSQGQSLITSGDAPTFPGGKVAVASKMDNNTAQLLVHSFDKAVGDVSLTLRFKYRILLPAAKGRIVIHWNKIYEKYQKDSAAFKSDEQKSSWLFGLVTTTTSSERNYKEVRKEMETLISDRHIEFDFVDLDPNSEKIKPIRDGFMSMLTQMLGELNQSADNKPPTPEEAEAMPDIKTGTSYKFVREKFMSKVQKGHDEFDLNLRFTYYAPVDVTENIKSWYTNLKANRNCVSEVKLDDPFYKRVDVRFQLDNDIKAMFDDNEINYVTLNIRKKGTGTNDYTDRLTIDKNYFTDKGLVASLTYAPGTDVNPEEVEYQSQWSFTGGTLYPESPQWEKSITQANALKAPLKFHKIEFEANLDKLKEANIVRAVMQVRFKKFKEEREVSLPISAQGTSPTVSKNVYSDDDLDGFVYRIIYYTSGGDKLATEWTPSSIWYAFAAIPDALKDKTTVIFQKAIEAGKVITATREGGKVSDADKVLDKFKDALGIVSK